MNSVTLIGRLTADPDLRFINTGTAISKFTIAIDKITKPLLTLSLLKFGAKRRNTAQLISKKVASLQSAAVSTSTASSTQQATTETTPKS